MTINGERTGHRSRQIADAVQARRRAELVSGLRGLARNPAAAGTHKREIDRKSFEQPTPQQEACDLCGLGLPDDHRHLLQLIERRIVCACEACWAMRAGEGDYRPTGNRTVWLPELDLPDELWASFQIPIGLAFFMQSTVTECIVAMYPSPAGATESELHFDSWKRMVELNSPLKELEPDIEGLIVNRLADSPQSAIAPIDRCYELTGLIKATWEGISGGPQVEQAVARFFERLRGEAAPA